MRFRKKPVEIEAMRWSGHNLRHIIEFTGLHPSAKKWKWEEYEAVVARDGLKIFTLEGPLMAAVGDWIIKGVKGEFYPCKPDIFLATYQPISVESETERSLKDATLEELEQANALTSDKVQRMDADFLAETDGKGATMEQYHSFYMRARKIALQLERELAEAEAELERRQAKIMRLSAPSATEPSKDLGAKSDNAQDIRQLETDLANARQALVEQAREIAGLRADARSAWVAAETGKADAYEAAATICEEMSYPSEGRDRWANKEEEWAAIKLEDAAKAIRERKAKACHVTQASTQYVGERS